MRKDISTNTDTDFSGGLTPGWYRLSITGTWTGSLAVSQMWVDFDGLDALTTNGHHVIALAGDAPLRITSTSMTGTAMCHLEPIQLLTYS